MFRLQQRERLLPARLSVGLCFPVPLIDTIHWQNSMDVCVCVCGICSKALPLFTYICVRKVPMTYEIVINPQAFIAGFFHDCIFT